MQTHLCPRLRSRMTCTKKRTDYSLNKKLLLLLGLWPGSCSKFRTFRIAFVYMVYFAYLLLQATWFCTIENNFNCVLHLLQIFLYNVVTFIRYTYCHNYMSIMHALYEEIEFHQEFLKNDKQSTEILQRCAESVHFITIKLTTLFCSWVVVIISISLLLPIPQMAAANYTRFWQRPVVSIEFEKTVYRSGYFLIVVNIIFNNLIVVIIEATFISFSEHICGMFKIARFMQILWNTFDMSFFLLTVFGCMALGAAAISFYQLIISRADGRMILVSLSVAFAMIIYAVFSTYFGQRIIDHSLSIFYEAYNTHWYKNPVGAQKLYLIILQRSIKSCSYSKYGLFISSFEGLTAILSTVFSYSTLLYSTQT